MSSQIRLSYVADNSRWIDDISLPTGGVTLRQRDKHTITLELRLPTGDTHRFRFRSANAPKGAGICLSATEPKPPGSSTTRPGYPNEIASHNLRQGSVHVSRTTSNGYRIDLQQGSRTGALTVAPRNERQDAVILTPYSD